MKFKVNIDKYAKERIKDMLEKKAAMIMSNIATQTYNTIVLGAPAFDYPLWSGQYIASWNISIGSPDLEYEPAPENKKGKPDITYSAPDIKLQLELDSPYKPIYITNAVPHAYLVEYEGTPTHKNNGWEVATHAVNDVLGKIKLLS